MNIINKDMQHLWYPCSNMRNYENFKPVHIHKAYGSYIELKDGRKLIDAVSSWWCKSLGHNHPRLQEALINQMSKFEHVMQPYTINDTIANLSEKLAKLTRLDKAFYASDGSIAVEIALKMSLHAHKNLGNFKRTKFIALSNGYHGESAGAMSVSDAELYKYPYKEILFKTNFIKYIPYVFTTDAPLWEDCSKQWKKAEEFLEEHEENLSAIIIEPLVQAAGNMRIYSKDFLKRLRKWTEKHGIYLIADEIMTGIGRTGKMLACEHADIKPDFICLSKGLTSGMLPLSVTLTSQNIYDIFYNNDPFLHSNTHYGNALAASVALEVLNIFEEEKFHNKTHQLNLSPMMHEIAKETGLLTNIRSIGAICAADLINVDPLKLYQNSMHLGAILRPIGNNLYWIPPLNISHKTLKELAEITKIALLKSQLS
jgi:adenosylmethionine---8-amino-7-oxononanoate aminotransferase